VLPVLFIVLASAALLAALAALFASLRASLAGPSVDVLWTGAEPDRGALEDEKNALLRALKDLEYEHEVGKIDDEDYARLERAYRARAKEVLGELDRDLRPYLSRAEALAGGAVEPKADKKKKKKKKDAPSPDTPSPDAPSPDDIARSDETSDAPASEAPSSAEAPTTEEPAALRTCPKCATVNDADAAFCKKCATPLEATS